MILPYKNNRPKISEEVFIAPNSSIIGNVEIGTGSSVWFGAVVRGDFQPIIIGSFTNVQDNCTIHVMEDELTAIGDYVTIGHNAIIHCRKIGNGSLIGMGAIILGYSEIGNNCIIGAGTIVTQRKKIPDNSLVFGNPAKIIRILTKDEIVTLRKSAIHYYECAKEYLFHVPIDI